MGTVSKGNSQTVRQISEGGLRLKIQFFISSYAEMFFWAENMGSCYFEVFSLQFMTDVRSKELPKTQVFVNISSQRNIPKAMTGQYSFSGEE